MRKKSKKKAIAKRAAPAMGRELQAELDRLFRPGVGCADLLDELLPNERARFRKLPVELQTIAQHVVEEVALPHPRVRTLYGLVDLVEWNGDEGTFGALREIEGYPYDRVLKIGDDTFLDVAGQVASPGSVHFAIGHDLDCATPVASSLLELLRQAKPTNPVAPYEASPSPSPSPSPPTASSQWEPTAEQQLAAAGSHCVLSLPQSFVVEHHSDGIVARCPSGAARVGVFGLPNLASSADELKTAGLFDHVRTELDELGGGLVETKDSTTRLMRLGNGYVRCYVKGGTAEQRLNVCRSLRPADSAV